MGIVVVGRWVVVVVCRSAGDIEWLGRWSMIAYRETIAKNVEIAIIVPRSRTKSSDDTTGRYPPNPGCKRRLARACCPKALVRWQPDVCARERIQAIRSVHVGKARDRPVLTAAWEVAARDRSVLAATAALLVKSAAQILRT